MNPQKDPFKIKSKNKRFFSACMLVLAVLAGLYIQGQSPTHNDARPTMPGETATVDSTVNTQYSTAVEALGSLAVKGRAPKTGYKRSQFGNGWDKSGTCDTRNRILARDLTAVVYDVNSCVVLSGTLNDPYTGKILPFIRGQGTSDDIQIDHVVALSDAWQKGAQLLAPALRRQLANDGLNLLAVDGPANMNKSDGDAATWLPSNKSMRCGYVARQISIKLKYSLWITGAEKTAMEQVLKDCPDQPLAQ